MVAKWGDMAVPGWAYPKVAKGWRKRTDSDRWKYEFHRSVHASHVLGQGGHMWESCSHMFPYQNHTAGDGTRLLPSSSQGLERLKNQLASMSAVTCLAAFCNIQQWKTVATCWNIVAIQCDICHGRVTGNHFENHSRWHHKLAASSWDAVATRLSVVTRS